MRVIHKQPLQVTDEQVLRLPVGAVLLDCQLQDKILCIWYLFDQSVSATNDVTFYVVGTGNPFPDTFPGRYFKTVQVGEFVWHIFWKPLHYLPDTQRRPVVALQDPNAPGVIQKRGAH